MDLMDWKQIELETTNQIRGAEIQIEVSKYLLKKAQSMIIGLGGKTLEEEDAEAKQQR